MKKEIIILSIILLLIVCFSTDTFATENSQNTKEITIDGDFKDWKDKPYVIDKKKDIRSSWLNFTKVKYFADDQYLYLYVEKLSSNKWYPWSFNVLILNAEKGKRYYSYIPTEYEYDKKLKYYQPSKYKKMNYAQFEVISDYSYYGKKKGTPIKISFNGENIETVLLKSNNNKRIEFKVPLEKVGLDGQNKELKFMLKSAYDTRARIKGLYPYDWVPDGKPIIITTGPTYWQLTSIPLFIIVAFIVNRKYRKPLKTQKKGYPGFY